MNVDKKNHPTGQSGKRHSLKIVLFLIPLIFICLVVFSTLGLRGIGAMLIVADPLREAEVAVALTGDLGDRVSAAVDLYKNGYVNALYITFTDAGTRNALVSKAIAQGFPSELIFVTEMTVYSTYDEAKAVKQLATDQGVESLIIITDPFHTLRTRLIFRNELRDSGLNIQVRPVSDHWYRSNTWWRTSEGIQLTLQEYLKIGFYLLGIK